ncbi:MAG: uncharacterized protein JWM16_4865 [Verrucomicrobiales bacterium]|jgi:hypothetical protein|nr:uncharacterized protein [Verrucomicrobiales bacterium]
MNKEKLEALAKDLRKEEPRSAYETLAGHQMAARTLDKCRASLLGWQGDFKFGCPMDREFFEESGLDMDEFRDFVATGASDAEVEHWVQEHANTPH